MKRFSFVLIFMLLNLTAEADEIKTYDMNSVSLTRFAIHALYAPKRLLVTPEGVHRTPMETEKQVSLFHGASIDAMPIASWHTGALYVTAVELKNLTTHPVSINLNQVIGNWQTAAVYPSNQLKPRDVHETSTLFLVSDKPFQTALTESTGVVR
jgi:integrating conjugative element protein (TIGR03749 family)